MPLIKNGLTAQGITATVQQTYQPTTQGRQDGTVVFISKVSERMVGTPDVISAYNSTTGLYDVTTTQRVETVWQIGCLSEIAPSTNYTSPTDILGIVQLILATSVKAYKDNNIGVYRIDAIRNPYFDNDKGRHEASPSFDFTVVHNRVILTTENKVAGMLPNIERL